ncbi:MAG: PstS family phosphate ABC transporter substrate-binding protein [Candidatus Limnocylindrales bacterium]
MNDTQRTQVLPRRARFVALAAGTVVFLASCGTGGASPSSGGTTEPGATTAPSGGATGALSGSVTIDGSSTVYLITAAVAEDFGKANPGVKPSVALSGTGGGFKKFCAGETDANDASRPIKTEDTPEAKSEATLCAEAGIEPVELKVAYDGLSVVVNPQNTWVDCLTVAELKAIFGPTATADTTWADIRGGWPADAIKTYQPGVDSGTFDYFTEEINGELDASTQAGTFSEDDNQLVAGVAGDSNGIGYFGYAYYEANQNKLKVVPVDGGGGCVTPSPDTVRDSSYTPLSRPLFVYPSKQSLARPEVAAFFAYYLANVATLAPEVGYIEMPDADLQASLAALAAATGN